MSMTLGQVFEAAINDGVNTFIKDVLLARSLVSPEKVDELGSRESLDLQDKIVKDLAAAWGNSRFEVEVLAPDEPPDPYFHAHHWPPMPTPIEQRRQIVNKDGLLGETLEQALEVAINDGINICVREVLGRRGFLKSENMKDSEILPLKYHVAQIIAEAWGKRRMQLKVFPVPRDPCLKPSWADDARRRGGGEGKKKGSDTMKGGLA